MFKIAICDDDPIYIEFLKREILSFTSDHESEIFSYTSSEFFLKNLDENFDLVFMDYKIDSLNGIDLASKMREIGSKSILVFCTGEIDPTPVLFKLDTFRFLTKSSSDENIHSEIGSIIDYLREKNSVQYLEVLKNKS